MLKKIKRENNFNNNIKENREIISNREILIIMLLRKEKLSFEDRKLLINYFNEYSQEEKIVKIVNLFLFITIFSSPFGIIAGIFPYITALSATALFKIFYNIKIKKENTNFKYLYNITYDYFLKYTHNLNLLKENEKFQFEIKDKKIINNNDYKNIFLNNFKEIIQNKNM